MALKSTLRIHWFSSRKDGQLYFRFVAKNGRTVMASQGYRTKRAMMSTIRLITNAQFGAILKKLK